LISLGDVSEEEKIAIETFEKSLIGLARATGLFDVKAFKAALTTL
jgi:hypothetical protein